MRRIQRSIDPMILLLSSEATDLQRTGTAAPRWQNTRACVPHRPTSIESLAKRRHRRTGWGSVGAAKSTGEPFIYKHEENIRINAY